MTRPPLAPGDAILLTLDAGCSGPQAVEDLLGSVVDALGADAAPCFATTHVVAVSAVRHLGALLWQRPPWQLDLLAVTRRVLPPSGATICRTTAHGVRLAGPGDGGTSALLLAAREAATGSRGRVVTFPGQPAVTGLLTVAEVLRTTAIDAVVEVAGPPVGAAEVLDTGGWVRPRWNRGRLELLVERSAGGLLRPFERREQHVAATR